MRPLPSPYGRVAVPRLLLRDFDEGEVLGALATHQLTWRSKWERPLDRSVARASAHQ